MIRKLQIQIKTEFFLLEYGKLFVLSRGKAQKLEDQIDKVFLYKCLYELFVV
jgi:hypothetical protein